jgi:two-component system, response regulator, stage 0 sporulation protein F
MSPICFASDFAARRVRAPTSCIFALSASEALELLRGNIEPQLIVILSDINMPGMDGLTLLREIKNRWPDIPVMMLTAYGDEERRKRAYEFGAADFVTKPVDFDYLKERLRGLHPPLA